VGSSSYVAGPRCWGGMAAGICCWWEMCATQGSLLWLTESQNVRGWKGPLWVI